jgi:hypothetical protein
LDFIWEHSVCSLPVISCSQNSFPVIALAEIKHILKRSGDTQKEKMDSLEAQPSEAFAEEHSHDHGA